MALARGMSQEERAQLRDLGQQVSTPEPLSPYFNVFRGHKMPHQSLFLSHRDNETREVANYFTINPNVKFNGHAGLGRHGGALIMSEAASATQKARKFVIKYSFGSMAPDAKANADDDLRNEYRWLKMLRGAEHIVQLIDFADCTLNLPGVSDGKDTYEASVQKRKDEAAVSGSGGSQPTKEGQVRRCPTFALEYLEFGTLVKFATILYRSGQKWVPSRLLWRIWLCMVRQCIAMAFPPDIPDHQYHGQIIREVMENKPLQDLTQNSAHGHNFMFAEPPLPGDEHEPNVPVLKLIDFGRGKLATGPIPQRLMPNNTQGFASRKNLVAAAKAGPLLPIILDYKSRNGATRTVQTIAPQIFIDNNTIDPDLRDLIVRINAWPWETRPSLMDVLRDTELGVAKGPDYPGLRTPDAVSLGIQETDADIRDFIQRFIYDAVDTDI
ncbi:hypothetical protein O1611_g7318 [Lasiodiplodia mahajangana]|uniref:Uncharacterized protein n=1 Tax=Lasiodiplodia mahajangana TaxID=1108764 RepID=A0ACC2JFQ0_9PEZI|nr:hypothetical protein O1611_g7318 [Lasiodiplodia mahajangana]